LGEYYRLNFQLMENQKFNIEFFDNLIPWEKDIYVNLLLQDLEKKAQEANNG
jgi:hypothetical protein